MHVVLEVGPDKAKEEVSCRVLILGEDIVRDEYKYLVDI